MCVLKQRGVERGSSSWRGTIPPGCRLERDNPPNPPWCRLERDNPLWLQGGCAALSCCCHQPGLDPKQTQMNFGVHTKLPTCAASAVQCSHLSSHCCGIPAQPCSCVPPGLWEGAGLGWQHQELLTKLQAQKNSSWVMLK